MKKGRSEPPVGKLLFIRFDFRLLDGDVIDPDKPAVAFGDGREKIVDLLFFTLDKDLDHAVGHVFDRTGQVTTLGIDRRETAEPDTLYLAFNDYMITFHIAVAPVTNSIAISSFL